MVSGNLKLGNGFKGILADIKIWKTFMYLNESKHYRGRLDGSLYGNLCLYLHLNEGRGGRIHDHSVRK